MALYHSVRGTNTYVLVGSPTIVNGIVSDFSSSNFIRWRPMNISYEGLKIRIYFTVSTALAETQTLFRTQKAGGAKSYTVNLLTSSSEDFGIRLSATGSTPLWDSDLHLSAGTEYYAEAEVSATDVKFTVGTDEGGVLYSGSASTTDFASEICYTCEIGNYSQGTPFANGSINMNKSFVISNATAWAGICPIEVQKHQLMGPVGYTVVGSPTIIDGVASGFSTSNRLSIGSMPVEQLGTAEWCVKFQTGATLAGQGIAGTMSNWGCWGFRISQSNKIVSTLGYSPQIELVGPILLANTNYIAKSTYNNTTKYFTLSLSSDNGQTWETTSKTVAQEFTLREQTIVLGATQQGTFTGSIDLNGTYIKVNGKLWFWQPQPTKKIYVNNVLVWEKSA